MSLETKRIIKSQDVVFLEGTKVVEGVHDNTPLSNQVKHVVGVKSWMMMELVKDVNRISLKERLVEDMEGDESTSNYFSEKEFAPP